jgi:hypothetical protein
MKNESEYKNIIGAIVLDLDFTLIGFRGGFSKLLDDLAFLNIKKQKTKLRKNLMIG